MKNIAIVCGGYSGEYEISVKSALAVKDNLDSARYNTYLIFIDRDSWYYKDDDGNEFQVRRDDFILSIDGKEIEFDGVFNAIHGSPGEDGKLLSFFDTIGMPYTSCDMDTSALTFNKFHCNLLVKAMGVDVAKSLSFKKGDKFSIERIVDLLGLPLFVKPARSGSSVGVSRVNTLEDFEVAVEKVFKVDDRIIFEEFLDGRELCCGVFKDKGVLKVLPITEIISKKEFFDYEAKYAGNLSDEITPPDNLSVEQETDIKVVSAMIYRKLGCKGVVRLDFMLTNTKLYLIEINSVPGLSSQSIIPQQATAMGISLKELFSAMIEEMFE